MSAKDLLHEHLLLGETVTVSLASRKDLMSLHSSLTTVKRRLEQSAAKCGFSVGTEKQSVLIEKISEDEGGTNLVYKIWLGTKAKRPTYKILDISTTQEPIGTK